MAALLLALLLSPAAAAIDRSLLPQGPTQPPLIPSPPAGLSLRIALPPSALPDWHALGVFPLEAGLPLLGAAPAPASSAIASLTALAQSLAPEQQLSQEQQASLDAFFSGEAPQSHAQRLAEIVEAAQASTTARRILAHAVSLARKRGPTPVVFAALGKNNLGEYDYAAGILKLDRAYLRGDTRKGAAALAHELIHVLQHSQGVPAEALELEWEAHALEVRILEELGVPRRQWDEFAREAARRLEQGPNHFTAWLADQLPEKLLLERGNFDDLASSLEDDVERLDGRASAAEVQQRFIEDIARLRAPKGQKRYARFARRVRALLARESARLRR